MKKCPKAGNKKKELNNGLDEDGYFASEAGQKAKARALAGKKNQVAELTTRSTKSGVAKPVVHNDDSAGPVSVVDEEAQASGTDTETEEARETVEGEGTAVATEQNARETPEAKGTTPATAQNARKPRVKSEPVGNVGDNGPHFEVSTVHRSNHIHPS